MSEWTETARRVLEDYCARSRAAITGTGADADEVVEDLRRHVAEEIANSKLSVVTEEDVRRILARVGEPKVVRETPTSSAPRFSSEAAAKQRERPGMLVLFSGVVLPLGTLIFELITGMSAGALFDPVPGWLQVALVALVPAANFLIWRAARAKDARCARVLGWLNGAAFGVALFYALLYLPFSPIAAFGIIWFGLGLVPLSPLIATGVTAWLRRVYCERTNQKKIPGGIRGLAITFGLLLLLQLQTGLTHFGLAEATSEEIAVRSRGIRLLRWFGDEAMLLRACYWPSRRDTEFDPVATLSGGSKAINTDQAREVYYRVTGRPFNAVPPPAMFTRAGRWTMMEEEFAWDDGLGGETVAGRVKGLSLLSSRMDAITEPDAALAYCEWTMEFKNVSAEQREARAQIALPPGAVVSRLTLWINGEEREIGRAHV